MRPFFLVLLALLLPTGTARAALLNTGNASDAASSTTQVSLSLPASLQPGDLLIAQIAYRNTGATLTAPNARWSLLQDTSSGTELRQRVYVRTVIAADVAGTSETWSVSGGSTRMAGGLSGWRSNVPGVYPGIEQSRSDTGTTSGGGYNLTAPGLTTANGGQLLRLFGVSYGNGFAVSPAGFGEYYRPESGAGPNGASLLGVGRAIGLPGSTGADTVSASGAGRYVAHSVFLYEPASISARLSWWLDESAWSGSAGEVLDQSGNGLHGTAFNGASTAISNPGPALATDGSGLGTCRYGAFGAAANQTRYVQVADSNLLDLTSFTLSLWVYPTAYPGSDLMSILSKDENYEFHLKPSGVLNWWWTDSGGARQFDSLGSVPLNAWTHIAVRFDDVGNTQRIYINGQLDASAGFTGTPTGNADPLQLGQDQGYAGRYFRGNLDELRVYSGALSDAQIAALAAERHPCVGVGVPHHLEFLHDGSALTCQAETLTLRACADASCSSLYTGSVTATLTPSGWVGGDTQTFSNGSTSLQLRHASAEAVTLGSSVVAPIPTSATLCNSASSGSCVLSFADSGLFFDVPNLLANKPSGTLDLVAARKSDSGERCVPAFASGTHTIHFWSAYSDPVNGTRQVSVNNGAVAADAPGTALALAFDANARASIEVRYADAGLMTLNARYTGSATTGDEGLVLSGTDQFVSKPYGLCLQAAGTCGSADAGCAVFPGGIRAGDSFPLDIRAVAWEADGEASTAAQLCSGNLVTPNFELAGIALSSAVLAPATGSNGVLTPASYGHARGDQSSPDVAVSEVGVFALSATPPAAGYFNETVGGGTSGPVGRFIPAYLGVVGSASLSPSCGSAFSYQGQPMDFATGREPTLTVTAYNRGNQVTGNYDRGAFWKLAAPAVGSYASVTGLAGLDARLASQGTATLGTGGADDGDGTRAYSWSGEQLLYQQAALPGAEDYPFDARIEQRFPAASLEDADGACHGSGGACQDYVYAFGDDPGSEVRLGRLRIGNAHGSELQGLALPLLLESWQNVVGGAFLTEGLDTCTVLGTPALDQYTGHLAAGETTPTLVAPVAGRGSLQLSAPGAGNDGAVQLSFPDSPAWLQYPWDGASRQLARGLASFGIYRGAAPLIFRRELYR